MTDYEIDKIAKRQAIYLAGRLKEDEELLDLMYPPRYLNIEEAADFVRIPLGTLRHKLDEIPHTKVGKRLVFTDRALTRYMQRNRSL